VLAAIVATFLLIVLGAVVRVTGSGLGCPDWPLCHGRLIPPFELHTLIEYSHRLAASLVSILVLATAFTAWLAFRSRPIVVSLSLLAVVLLVVQVVLGGITVILELPPDIVTAHLGTALALLANLVVLFIATQAAPSWTLTIPGVGFDVLASGRRGRPICSC
jgi:heme A synthase